MSPLSYPYFLATAVMVSCSNAWFYQSSTNQGSNQLLSKNQFLLPPYPSYQHELLHQNHHPHHIIHDNRFYGSPGEFAEPTSYNELSFEGPYEVTAPRIPGLYFRLSSGVFVPVKAVYSFPPFLERIIQRVQGYYSVYNPPDTLGFERPIPSNGVPLGGTVPAGGVPLPPTLEILPVIPPQLPPPSSSPGPDTKPEEGNKPEEAIKPDEQTPTNGSESTTSQTSDSEPSKPSSTEQPETSSSTEPTREETTATDEDSSATDSLESTDSTIEETTTA